ncbi:MAG: hypothetical protein ACF8OB_04205 [Phycisphaeraceae bacterium JB051]
MFNRHLVVTTLLGACFLSLSLVKADTDLTQLSSDEIVRNIIRYDAELNQDDFGDQQLAEKYYLEYLNRTSDWQAQAWAYCKLGTLFITNYTPAKGEKPDYDKSETYFKKCLKITGKRITTSSVRARSMLISYKLTDELRMQKFIEHYQFLLRLEQTDISQHWHAPFNLWRGPGDKKQSLHVFKTRLLPSLLDAISHNMVEQALALKNPQPALQQILDTFPSTPAAKLVQKQLNKAQ